MNACHPSRATHLIVGAAFLAATTAVVMISATPVLAFTCEDVRGLTKAKQNYWSKLLNLTPDQRHRIWLECYSQVRVTETKDNSLKPLVNGQ
jgi:Spy/CpxP family protein refolding chaperone